MLDLLQPNRAGMMVVHQKLEPDMILAAQKKMVANFVRQLISMKEAIKAKVLYII